MLFKFQSKEKFESEPSTSPTPEPNVVTEGIIILNEKNDIDDAKLSVNTDNFTLEGLVRRREASPARFENFLFLVKVYF